MTSEDESSRKSDDKVHQGQSLSPEKELELKSLFGLNPDAAQFTSTDAKSSLLNFVSTSSSPKNEENEKDASEEMPTLAFFDETKSQKKKAAAAPFIVELD